MILKTGVSVCFSMVALCLAAGLDAAVGPVLLPTPKVIKVTGGEMPLTAGGRIVATDPKLKPLAEILSREILAIAAVKLQVVDAEPRHGDIVLALNPKIRADNDIIAVQNREVVKTRDFAHTITVADTCVVEGWDYRSVCEGTATLLQSIALLDGKAALPKMTVKDWPFADYTGYMIDCARQDVPLHALKSAVIAMRFWKVRYLHLHLSDESALMFPLRKWPDAGKYNGAINWGDTPRVWDRQELIKLVEFADARGVTLVPEFETPGHCGSYQCAMLPALGHHNLRMMDIANDSIYPNLEEVVNDMCDVFKSTPYFHIGGDEIELDRLKQAPHTAKYLKDHNMREADKGGMDDLLKQHVLRMNEFIKKRGKKTVYWGGYQGPPQDPELKDCIVYSWYAGARDAQDKGMTTITVPWEIRGPFEKWNLFSSNADMLKRTDSVLGACRVAWEQSAETYVNLCIYEAIRQEGTWAPDTVGASLKDLQDRERACATQLAKLVKPVNIAYAGNIDGDSYAGEMTITMTACVPPDIRIHYTLDGTEPTARSALYEKPIAVTGRLRPRAALFDPAGELVGGYTFGSKFRWTVKEKNLTTGKPVKASRPHQQEDKPENAADGCVDIARYWGSDGPAWWQVDLQKECTLDRVRVFPYWDGNRYYQYTISVGTDTNNLVQVVDASKNITPETEQGRMHQFVPVPVRYLRIDMLKNSDNPAVHLVEVQAYEVGNAAPVVVPPSIPGK